MISIIGSGRVGSAIAFLIASSAMDDIVLVNKPKTKAVGESLDIVNAIPQKAKISIEGTDDISKIRQSDIVVITASTGKMQEERTDLLPFNLPIIREISKGLVRYSDNAKILVVTNPVDIITHQILKETEFSPRSVIGMGSSLDSNRFRYLIGKEFGAKQEQIDGIVMGEHGSTMVPIFSSVKIDFKGAEMDEKQRSHISSELKNYWRYLRVYKGESVFGAAKNTFDMIKSILHDESLFVPAQTFLTGEYGLSNLCIGVPVVIKRNGVDKIIEMNLNQSELDLLNLSALKIKKIIDKIKMEKSY